MVPQQIASAFITFIVGFFVGYIVRGIVDGKGSKDNATTLLLVVSLAWLISVLVAAFNPNYSTPIEVHALMGGIVGYFYKQREEHDKRS